MFPRAEVTLTVDGQQPESPRPETSTGASEESTDAVPEPTAAPGEPGQVRPNLTGDLENIVGTGPCFRVSVRGYDRLQVDNYVAWAEAELLAARRETDDLASRYGACLAELETSRELLSHSPEGRELSRITERMADMLRLAADEAADVTAAGAAEADRIVAEATAAAEATLRRARETEEAATALGERSREEAVRLLREAAAERDRLDAEAADARARAADAAAAAAERLAMEQQRAREEHEAAEAARRAAVIEEIEDLERRREEVRACCRLLTDQIGRALGTLAAGLSDELAGLDDARDRMKSNGDRAGSAG